jgi:hypothetical protein
MPIEERKVLEDVGQEKIEFTPENTPAEQQLPIDEVADEKTQAEITDIRSEPKRTPEIEIQSGEILSTTEELIQDDGQNTSEAGKPQPPKEQTQKRWKVWREKIQGFIKKLFA